MGFYNIVLWLCAVSGLILRWCFGWVLWVVLVGVFRFCRCFAAGWLWLIGSVGGFGGGCGCGYGVWWILVFLVV